MSMEIVPFHFVLLSVGEVLKQFNYATPQKIQNYIQEDNTFGVRLPLDTCRLALRLMKESGFLVEMVEEEVYERA